MDRNDLQAWLLVAMAIAAMACAMWLISLDRAHAAPKAQGVNYCPPGEVMSPNFEPWPGYDGPGTCAICCDRPDGSGYWYRMPNWHSVCYPNRRTPTRRPTRTRRPTATPTATATNTSVPPTDTPAATQTPTETPTWTITPTAHAPRDASTPAATPRPVFPVPPVQAMPTRMPTSQAMPTAATPAPNPPSPNATPRAQQGRTRSAWRPQCLPPHAARPVALCRSASGSGWWLYFIGPGGRIETGPHVPYPSPAMAGRRAVLKHYITGAPIVLVWKAESLQVLTMYGDGKAYHFFVDVAGVVRYIAW